MDFEEKVEKKESFLFKKLDVTFVYVFIFLVGILMVYAMTSYLNSKVQEFSDVDTTYVER